MKKFIFASAIVLAAVFSSCGDTNRCYEVTAESEVLGIKYSATTYVWGTKNDLDAAIAEAKKNGGEGVKVTYKRTSKSQSDCYGVSADVK